jgi:hypothetical protein
MLIAKSRLTFTSSENIPRVVTLARHGYFAPSPSMPSCAVHVDVLRFCTALRRHASSIGIQSITMALCEMHNVSAISRMTADTYLFVGCLSSSPPHPVDRRARLLFGRLPDDRHASGYGHVP